MASAVGGVGSSNIVLNNQQAQIDGAPVGRPIPDMPALGADDTRFKSFGATGTAIFGGIITSEEYNQDFYWKDAVKIYEQMSRSDGQIAAIMYMLELPIRRASWTIEPASSDPKDMEIASFVKSCLFTDLTYQTATGRTLTQKWDDVLRHILMSLRFGFMPLEVCYRKEDGWIKWSRFIPLLPRTVWRWWVGEDNELAGIQQWTFKNYNYQFIDIPADKLMLFSHRQEGNNYEGVSLLRAAYPHWWYKTQFYKIDAIGIEKNAVVPPVVYLPENASSADVGAAQLIGQNIRANEMLSVTLPFGWDLTYPKNSQKYAAQTMPSIEHHDVMIARSVLAQFINLGSTETGAYNLNASQMAAFLASLQAEAKYIEDVWNSDAIPRLVDYNYSGVEVYPTLKCSKISAMDFDILSGALQKLVNMPTPLITPDPELEDYIRDELGLPSAPKSTISTTNPTAESTPERPETNPSDHADAESKSIAGTPATPNAEIDMSIADGDASGTLQAMSEIRLLREAFEEIRGMDAVDRGMIFYNANHDGKGRFTSGGSAVTTVVKGQGRSIRGEGGKRMQNPAHQSGVSDKQFHSALVKSYTNRGDSTGVASIRAVRNDVMNETGMTRGEFDNRLLGMQSLPGGRAGLGAHLEPDDDHPSTPFGIRGSNTENYSFMSLHLNGSFLTGNAPDGTPSANVRGRKL